MSSLPSGHARRWLLATCCILLAPWALADAAYRWVGPDGVTVLSDKPPPAGVPHETIKSRSRPYEEADPIEAGQPANDDISDPTSEEQLEYLPRVESPPEKDPRLCQQAKDNLATLQLARVRVPDANGEYRYLDEQEKARQRQNAQELIATYCEN